MPSLVSDNLSRKLDSTPGLLQNEDACDLGNDSHHEHSSRKSHRQKTSRIRRSCLYRPPTLLLFIALLVMMGVSTNTNNHYYYPFVFAEARALTSLSPTTTSKSLMKRKPSTQINPLYVWGNFGHEPERVSVADQIQACICRRLQEANQWLLCRRERFLSELTVGKVFSFALRCARGWVFWFFSKDCLASIYEDRWHAERDPDKFFGSEGMWVSKGAHKDVVRRRISRSRRNRQWVGLGYTPRLVWLVGVLLRGTFQCTAIPKVFNPSMTGWGAGTILGAKCTHQEWIATFMIGWFGSEYYWKYLFGCRGPPFAEPGFTGIPVFITKIRDVRL